MAGTGDKVWARIWLTGSSDPNYLRNTYSGYPLGFRVALVPEESIPPDLREIIPAIEDQVSRKRWQEAFQAIDEMIERADLNGFPDIVDQAFLLRNLIALAEGEFATGDYPTGSREHTATGQRYLNVPIPMTWEEAETFCRSFGGHLATITSKEEQEFILKEVPGSLSPFWLGASGRRSWRWSNKESWGFANWDENQPDNAQHWSRRFAVVMNPEGEGKWRDVAPDRLLPFVLEWDGKR